MAKIKSTEAQGIKLKQKLLCESDYGSLDTSAGSRLEARDKKKTKYAFADIDGCSMRLC
ncbi:hypothetical protein DM01DRAFT_1333279 [Hesseltinella vesiculosa]|uniref:Uncharacterized protein n=1 Tax=Hesseltinella vesiculosa TaxID=101127 RepID=A0A1X2GT74_9FUNG|nr:hypothetical protein DM01DRAFT_1333279 [Hesseltinella vesiculosa]